MSTPAKVDTPIDAYRCMAERWELPDALLGGTRAMRAAANRWLPQEPKEEPEPYQRRVARSFLLEAYRDGLERLSARPFAKPVAIRGELPEALTYLLRNADGQGADLTTFAHGFLKEAIHRGLNHALVDLPPNPQGLVAADPAAPRTNPDAPPLTPYFRVISPADLIGWRGTRPPTEIRFKHHRMEPDGEWGERRVDEIRVYSGASTRLFERRDSSREFAEVGPPTQVAWGTLPLVSLNLERPGCMTARPALEALAYKNQEHWISRSDQSNILRFARLAMMVVTGVQEKEAEKIVPGPGAKFTIADPAAKAYFLEVTGRGVDLGRQDLIDIEASMAMLALLPMLQQTGNPTATGKAIDQANVQSNLHAWVRLLEHALEEMFRTAARLLRVALPADFGVDVCDEFELSLRSGTDLQQLLDARRAGLIPARVFLAEIKRRQLIADTWSVEDMEEELADEVPPMPPPFTPSAAATPPAA